MKEQEKAEEPRKSSDFHTSGTSTDSAHSAVYLISSESEQKQGIFELPSLSIRPEKGNNKNENKLILKFGDDRPAGLTTVKNDGRHVSAYVLFREAMIARLDDQEVEDVEQLLREFVAEYIEAGDALNKFEDYVRLINENHAQFKSGSD